MGMDKDRFSHLNERLDECLHEFMRDDDGHDKKRAVVGAGTAVGAGAGYAALRKHKKTRTGVLRAEVKAENTIRGAVGKARTASRKGLKTVRDLPRKAGEMAKLKRVQAGNLVHRGREAVGAGYASPVSRAGRKVAKVAGDTLKKSKGIRNVLIAGARKLRFESAEELRTYGDRLVALQSRLDALDLD